MKALSEMISFCDGRGPSKHITCAQKQKQNFIFMHNNELRKPVIQSE